MLKQFQKYFKIICFTSNHGIRCSEACQLMEVRSIWLMRCSYFPHRGQVMFLARSVRRLVCQSALLLRKCYWWISVKFLEVPVLSFIIFSYFESWKLCLHHAVLLLGCQVLHLVMQRSIVTDLCCSGLIHPAVSRFLFGFCVKTTWTPFSIRFLPDLFSTTCM